MNQIEACLYSFFLGLYVFGMGELGRLLLCPLHLAGLGFCIGFIWAFGPLAVLCEYARRYPAHDDERDTPPSWPLAG